MPTDPQNAPRPFPETRWSLVLKAGARTDPDRSRALEELCRDYWRPLFAFARRSGLEREDAEDAVQDFFATALRRELFARADASRGKLRSFLLTALRNHLADRAASAKASRRSPEGGFAAIDLEAAEAEWARMQGSSSSPDAAFERQWARDLVRSAIAATAKRYAQEGKQALFEALRAEALEDAGSAPRLPELSDGARRVAIHRLRKRFREALHAAVADTVEDPADTETELHELARLLSEAGA